MNDRSNRFLHQLGQLVCQRRQKIGLSQEQLAQRAGMHRAYISDFERGGRNLTVGSLRRIADALRVKLPVLLKSAELKRDDISETHAQAG